MGEKSTPSKNIILYVSIIFTLKLLYNIKISIIHY